VRLSELTTLGVGGPAGAFVRAGTDDELIEAVAKADTASEPVLVIGGGSNLVVVDDGFPGTVIQIATRGIAIDGPAVTVAAGEDWDDVVARTLDAGLAGLEPLSGIPGLAGATPIQNVGAYGREVADVITAVRAYDRETGQVVVLPHDQCAFAYRTSAFKGRGRYVVLGVRFLLTAQPESAPVRYAELAAALGISVGGCAPSGAVRSAVLALRRRKGMVLDPGDQDSRSAGSFFTNPVVDPVLAPPAAPRWDAGGGMVKVPAAWLIEQAGFTKGHRGPGGARISAKHSLALVNSGDATTADLISLAREIRDGVHARFGIELKPEPIMIGVTL
jgi:UDP-N-acetylmuramate dehydrogenase